MSSFPKNYRLISVVPVSKEVLPKIRVSKLMREGHGKCARCGIEATHVATYTLASENHQVIYGNIFADRLMMTADHILPRALGGSDKLSNLQLMCYRCNTRKGMIPTEEEMDLIVLDRSKHFRPTFTAAHQRYIVQKLPQLARLYDLAGKEEGIAIPFKRTRMAIDGMSGRGRRKKVWYETNGLVWDKHPHNPNWGWVRIFEKYPELRTAVCFYRETPAFR